MAHALGQQLAEQHSWALVIDSAGIRANFGSATTPLAVTVLQQQGIHWEGVSQPLSLAQLRWADQVWVMTQEHFDVVQQLQQELADYELAPVALLLGDKDLSLIHTPSPRDQRGSRMPSSA